MIRHFLESDFESIYALGSELTNSFSKTNNLKEMYKDSFSKVLVYERDKEIVGFLMYIELEETVDILDIIVKKEMRGKKIASCLMDYMISDLADTVKVITLEVRKSNEAAICLYKKFGFEIVNVRKKYYDDGEDGYLMGKVMER